MADVGVRQGRLTLSSSANWAWWRNVVAWPLIVVFGTSSYFFWTAVIATLHQVGGFPGIISWQVLAAPFPIYRGYQFACRAFKRKDGRFETPLAMRLRLVALIIIVGYNTWQNAYVIKLCIQQWVVGRLSWTMQDSAATALAITATITVVSLWHQSRISGASAGFWWIMSWRVSPTFILVTSPGITELALVGVVGLAGIAAQAFVLAFIELGDAESKYYAGNISEDNLVRAWWGIKGELGNLAACLVLLLARVVA